MTCCARSLACSPPAWVLPPPKNADGSYATSLAALFARSAEAEAEVTNTLGTQVRQAVELLVGELSRLDREASGALLGASNRARSTGVRLPS